MRTVEQIIEDAKAGITDEEIVSKLQTYQRCLKDALISGRGAEVHVYAKQIDSITKNFGDRIERYINEKINRGAK